MDQLTNLIKELSLKHRLLIVAVAAAVVAGLVAFVHFKHEGDFRPLYTAMAPEDAAGVVQKLRETGVDYRLSENGGTVMVASEKLAESRLALAAVGLPKTGRIGFELFDKSNFGATEFVEHINYKRALEGELERSVMSLAEVEQARVHLTLPKESVFLDQQEPAKASVMVKLRPGAPMSPANVVAVTNLVASAVEGLTPDGVSVVDMNGMLLSRPKKGPKDEADTTNESLEVRQQIEKNLVAKINQTLEPLLGAQGFRAGASVECDLTSGDQQEETLDPEHSVMVSSQKTEDVSEKASAGGIPGTASNLPQQASTGNKGSNGVSRRTENVTYQTSRVIRHTTIPQGVIRRMSLAVLVGQTVSWEGQGATKHRVVTPPTPETLTAIKDLVAGIAGVNAERGDQLVVETLPFESNLTSEPPKSTKPLSTADKTPPWLQFMNTYHDLWAPACLGIGILLVLGRGLFKSGRRAPKKEIEMDDELASPAVLTELSPAAAEIAATAAIAPPAVVEADLIEVNNNLADRVRVLAQRDPDLTLNVLRMWLQESKNAPVKVS